MFELLLVAVVGLNVWADFMDRRSAVRSDATALSLWTTITQFLLVMPLLGLVGWLTPPQIALCALVGAFTALARIPWYRALSLPGENLSHLAPFTRLSTVLVLVFAFTLLGEPFSSNKLLGALLVVAGALAISLSRSFTGLRSYFANNKAIFLVLVFASSLAVIAVFYKSMMNAGVPIIATYFFLKLFQCATMVAHGYHNRALRRSFGAILDLQLFVQARALQTLAALLYLFVLRHVDLSTAEPIAAAIAPLLYLAIDKISQWRLTREPRSVPSSGPHATKRSQSEYVAVAGYAVMAIGLYFVVKG